MESSPNDKHMLHSRVWIVAALAATLIAAGTLAWNSAAWNTYSDGSITFRYPAMWETFHFGDPAELFVAPIFPGTNKGVDIISNAPERHDLDCSSCAASTEASAIRLGGVAAQKQVIRRGSAAVGDPAYVPNLVVLRILPQPGSPACENYEVRYNQGYLPEQQRIIDRILDSFACSKPKP